MKKRALSILFVLVLALGLTTTALAAELPFKDVPSDAWYCQDVENAYNMGLINGRDEVAALAGYWETERPVDGDAYLFIEDDGSWSLYVWFEGDSQPVEQDRGSIVPSAGEPDAYYANSALDDSSTYFRFTPAEENDVGSDLILWGANPDDNSIVFLREE